MLQNINYICLYTERIKANCYQSLGRLGLRNLPGRVPMCKLQITLFVHAIFESPTAQVSRSIFRSGYLIILTFHPSPATCLLPDTVYFRLPRHPHLCFRYVITRPLHSTIPLDLLLSEVTLPLLVAV